MTTAPTTGIIVLEGADSSGKTTLANHLRRHHNAAYIHGSVHHDFWLHHIAALRRAVRLSTNRLVVIDRNWLSHLVYGQVFGNAQYDSAARCLDRVLRRYGALYVLTSPADQARQAERWAADKAAGRHEHYSRVREVIAMYADLRDGNLAHPGVGYIDQLIQFQDFAARDDVIVYDVDRHTSEQALRSFVGRALGQMCALQQSVLPRLGENLAGRWSLGPVPRYLFVGDAASYLAPAGHPRWPLVTRDSAETPLGFFNRSLHLTKVREDRCVYLNAFSPWDHHSSLAEMTHRATRVVAIGNYAARKLREVGGAAFVLVEHPALMIRRDAQVEDYGRMLGEALK